MEQHPVPRNISGFQFHLIGDMTLSQFIYLAFGVGIAFLIFKAAPFPSMIKYPLAGAFGFLGFAFAFIPIQERPLDRWILAFIKSVFSPTQYLWQKDNQPPEIMFHQAVIRPKISSSQHIEAHKEAKEKLQLYLSTLPKTPHDTLNTAEQNYIRKTLSLFGSSVNMGTLQLHQNTAPAFKSINISTLVNMSPSASSPTPHQPVPPPHLDKAVVTVPVPLPVQNITPIPKPMPQSASPTSLPPAEYLSLQKQLTDLAREKELLARQLLQFKEEMEKTKNPSSEIVKPQPAVEPEPEPTVKFVTPKAAVNEVGMQNLSQAPNIITGVIKDPQRKVLPNIIITIKDKTGMPLRAIKTNKLGQFATATPLSNGTYLLEVEDPLKRYVFDIAEITLSGKIFLPIEINSKGEKELMREKLTKELFGSSFA